MAGPESPAGGRGRGKGGRGGKARGDKAAAKSPKRRSSRGSAAAAAPAPAEQGEEAATPTQAVEPPAASPGDGDAAPAPTAAADADTGATADSPSPAPAASTEERDGTAAAAAAAAATAAAAAAEATDEAASAPASSSSPAPRGRSKGRAKGGRGGASPGRGGGGGRGGGSRGGRGKAQSPGRGGRGRGGTRGRGGGGGGVAGRGSPAFHPGGRGGGGPGRGKRGAGGGAGAAGAGGGGGGGVKRKRTGGLVTITEINEDELMAVANQNWAPGSKAAAKGSFKPKLVSNIYRKELRSCMPTPGARAGPESSSRLQLLEFSAFLENYLWPNFDPEKSSTEHLMSTILLINSKFHEGVSVWESLGISEGRLGNLPVTAANQDASAAAGAAVPASPAAAEMAATDGAAASSVAVAEASEDGSAKGKGKGKGGGEVGGTVKVSKTGKEAFTAFFESVLGLAMGDWPKPNPGPGPGSDGAKAAAPADKEAGEGDRDGDGDDHADGGDAMEEEEEEEETAGETNDGDEAEEESAAEPTAGKEEEEEEEEEDVRPPPAKVARKGGKGNKSSPRRSTSSGGAKGGGEKAGEAKGKGKGGKDGKKKRGREIKKRAPRRPGWDGLSMHERIAYVTFLVNVFQSLEEPVVRSNVLRLAYLPLWGSLQPGRLALELRPFPQLKRHWQHLKAKGGQGEAMAGMERYEYDFLPSLIRMFLSSVESFDGSKGKKTKTSRADKENEKEGQSKGEETAGVGREPPRKLLEFCERFMEFLIDLLCQLPTRRFLCVVLEDMRVLERCSLSKLAAYPKARLFGQLLEMFRFYLGFEINDQTGRALTDKDMMEKHHSRVHVLQKVVFEHYLQALPEFPFVSSVAAGKRDFLAKTLGTLSAATLKDLAQRMVLVRKDEDLPEGAEGDAAGRLSDNKAFLVEVLLNHFADRDSQIQQVNELPLYPNETLLWDENLVPLGQYYGGKVMALPKLNLQFLTSHDYLLRSFNLFRLESAYEIRADLVDTIRRTNPRRDPSQGGGTRFEGWARMATPISGVSITEVKKPNLGEKVPAEVLSEVSLNLAHFDRMHMREEWDSLREHDVVFLVSIQSPHDAEGTGILNLQQQWQQQADQQQMHMQQAPMMMHPQHPQQQQQFNGQQQQQQHPNGNCNSNSNGNMNGGRGGYRGRGRGRGRGGGRGGGRGSGGRGRAGGGGSGEKAVKDEEDPLFPARYGVVSVRGAEVYELADEEGNLLNDPASQKERNNAPPVGNKRTLRLRLDPAQYHADMKAADMVYETVNLLVRRNAKENNFKGILETIRDLMNTSAVGQAMPPWLHDIFLGYGDPAGAHYRNLPEQVTEGVDFGDTLLDTNHAREAFPGAAFKFADELGGGLTPEQVSPPFRLSFSEATNAAKAKPKSKAKSKAAAPADGDAMEDSSEGEGERDGDKASPPSPPALSSPSRDMVTVTPYKLPNPGPYPQDVPKKNKVRFTPVQVEAIRSGMNPGLTMVVGPPGTGKTDVAVQTISNLYHSFPNQRTIMVAHSNAALNDLFEKIMEKDIDERHLLRLGAGERELREGTMKDFSKFGRVNYTLKRRLELLAEVQRLAETIGVEGDVGYTGETAEYFQLFHVTSRIERFEAELEQRKAAVLAPAATPINKKGGKSKSKKESEEKEEEEEVMVAADPVAGGGLAKDLFPFHGFFANAPAGDKLFGGKDLEEDLEVARGCFRHISKVFEELADYRAFELLRSHSARSDYLLTKQARIIALTCTHAALIRRRLLELGFRYDNMVMEESAQILEVETFIPMMLQNLDPVLGCRLKRVILIGDHHQLPPVVKSMAFQKYSKLDQSLFTRFVRLGTPTVQLNAQGRARPEIAALYNWRYKDLGNLPLVQAKPQYLAANPGFAYDYQMVDVPDFEGRGEATPTAFFYQNLGEAEYVVATYQYMRLLGYPASKISILTTYNGQCQLIQDVVQQRCANNDIFGEPGRIATVDKYQGQQNDYVLLSLVRTKTVGHVRDVRRLVVALSRARLGLYVFCRQSLFEDCRELAPAFQQMMKRPSNLRLVLNEAYPGGQRAATGDAGPPPGVPLYEMRSVTDMGVVVHQMASAVMAHRAALSQVTTQQAALQKAAEDAANAMREEGKAQAAAVAAAKAEEDKKAAELAARAEALVEQGEQEEEEEDGDGDEEEEGEEEESEDEGGDGEEEEEEGGDEDGGEEEDEEGDEESGEGEGDENDDAM